MLTPSYCQTTDDPHLLAAMLTEWALREQAYRKAHPEEVPAEATLAEMVPARDAGDVCGVCGCTVTWTDHLPPVDANSTVRCFVNVTSIHTEVVIDDIFRRVERVDIQVPGIETPVFRAFVETGYDRDDPKHPDFHETFADHADMREDF